MSSSRAAVLTVRPGTYGIFKTVCGAGKIKTSLMIKLRHYLPFSPSFSHSRTVEFSRGYRIGDTERSDPGTIGDSEARHERDL